MKTPQLTLAASLITISAIAITGCGQQIAEKAVEKTTEKAIEQSTGGKANVDLSNGNFNINTKDGTYQAGTNVQLPSNFPTDVYKIDGTVTAALTNNGENAYWVTIDTPKPASDVNSAYQTELAKSGWKITANADLGGMKTIAAEKDQRQLAVLITTTDSKTTVTLSETKK